MPPFALLQILVLPLQMLSGGMRPHYCGGLLPTSLVTFGNSPVGSFSSMTVTLGLDAVGRLAAFHPWFLIASL
jgi:hypothetical protein